MFISELLHEKNCIGLKHVSPDASLSDMSARLRRYNVGVLIVMGDRQQLVGIVSERDLVAAVASGRHDFNALRVSDIMTADVLTCAPDDDVTEVLDLMNTHNIRHVPVIEAGKPKNILSIKDFHFAYQSLQIEARTDPLTGLANRRRFMELADLEMNRCRRFQSPLSLAILDLDHFKSINDTYGHDAGDHVLREVAALLQHELRIYDGIGRLGGEEFAVIFPHANKDGAAIACQRIVEALRQNTIMTAGHEIIVTASIGLVEMVGADTSQAMLNRADALLYDAKGSGRDQVVVEEKNAQHVA
jgi:diguanylate cyclase (GGDEF)-like protein